MDRKTIRCAALRSYDSTAIANGQVVCSGFGLLWLQCTVGSRAYRCYEGGREYPREYSLYANAGALLAKWRRTEQRSLSYS